MKITITSPGHPSGKKGFERSAGAVIFYKSGKKIDYLLVRSSRGEKYWGFAKGGIERGEKEKETARREIKEETGIDKIEFINGFKEWFKVFYKRDEKEFLKTMIFYLVQAKTKKVKLSWENMDYTWLGHKDALEKLTYKDSKDVLEKANKFLAKK